MGTASRYVLDIFNRKKWSSTWNGKTGFVGFGQIDFLDWLVNQPLVVGLLPKSDNVQKEFFIS